MLLAPKLYNLSELEQKFKSTDSDNADILQHALMLVLLDYERLSGKKVRWLHDAVYQALSKKQESAHKHERIGCIVAALVEHGSSQNQAIKFVADWLVIADRKASDSYYSFRKKYSDLVKNRQVTRAYHYAIAQDLEKYQEKGFSPSHSHDLRKAYASMAGEMDEIFREFSDFVNNAKEKFTSPDCHIDNPDFREFRIQAKEKFGFIIIPTEEARKQCMEFYDSVEPLD